MVSKDSLENKLSIVKKIVLGRILYAYLRA